MIKPVYRTIALASVIALPLVSGRVALAQTTSPQSPELASPESVTVPAPADSQSVQTDLTNPTNSQTPVVQEAVPPQTEITASCPPNQFPSAFPDVAPTDWAYEAVNRLAIGEIRCFPVSGQ